jgi:hypothetical protein
MRRSLSLETSNLDEQLLEMGLALTPAQRLQWLEDTVEELLPWCGLANRDRGHPDPRQSAPE